MNNNIDTKKLFYELIKVALGNPGCLSRTPSDAEWVELYAMAKKQSLVGVCFAGVQKLQAQEQTPSEMLYLQWMGMAARIQQRNELVNRQCAELQTKFSADGWRSCVLKGQSAGALYSIKDDGLVINDLSALRQSGDIDVWLEGTREDVIKYVQSVSPTKTVREHHVEMGVFPDTEVEVHFWPAVIRHFVKNRRLLKWFEEHRKEVFSQGKPTLEFHAIQMMAHMYHHLFDSGIGLRQVMDYYFVLSAIGQQPSAVERHNELYSACKHIGMTRFAAAMMYVLGVTMGLSQDLMLCEPNKKDGRFLLGEIMAGGNFGHHAEKKTRDTRNKLTSFYTGVFRNLKYLRFNYFDWFWSPLWRLYYFGWRKVNGYQ